MTSWLVQLILALLSLNGEIAVDNKVVGSLQNQKKHYELQSEVLQLSQP